MRVQKALSAAGLMSRRRAEDAIRSGRVMVDGRTAELGDRVDPVSSRITIDGKLVPVAPELVSYVLYKPPGVISTAHDPHGRQTVLDLVDPTPRVWPVGRLDSRSEGLLLLTNDGTLTNLVTHPRHGVTKTYVVSFLTDVPAAVVRAFRDGIELEDGPARALAATVIDRRPGKGTLLELVMAEGRNREIRRMADAVGLEVERLVRIAIGPITDRTLRPGAHRPLTTAETMSLYATATV